MFIHTVFFWLNENAPSTEKEALAADCQRFLGKIPGVRQLYTGHPANTPRPIVDNSYAVGLTVILDDSAAHDVYQEHPLHKQFITAHNAHWKRVQVYDFK